MVGFAQINSTKRLILSTKREVTSPRTHTPLRQLADFLQRGRCDVKQYALVVWGAKLVQKLVLKKYVFVNLFIKFLKEERRVIFLLFFVRHILGCASSPTFLRLSFAYPSLIVRSSFAVSISEVRGK